ncbi:MAG TPA: hypothetical protein VFX22_03765, partial [Candidatus Kapabacteria bacterium]|nr:hypothetical protein [Candidatus Kapabacteria bacterium]
MYSNAQIYDIAICPGGKSIAVTYDKGRSSFIYEIDMSTGNAMRLTSTTIGEESSPAFSPDGKFVAYSYYMPKKINQRI